MPIKTPSLAKVEFAPFKALSLAEGGLGVGITKGNAYHAVILILRQQAKNPQITKNA